MPSNTPSPPANSSLQRFVARLIARLEKEGESKHPGVLMSSESVSINDGSGYGRPDVDEHIPEFVRKDTEEFLRSNR